MKPIREAMAFRVRASGQTQGVGDCNERHLELKVQRAAQRFSENPTLENEADWFYAKGKLDRYRAGRKS